MFVLQKVPKDMTVIAIVATVIVIITLVVVKTKQHKKQMFDCHISESESGALILSFNLINIYKVL